jgi:hypothetical protein
MAVAAHPIRAVAPARASAVLHAPGGQLAATDLW